MKKKWKKVLACVLAMTLSFPAGTGNVSEAKERQGIVSEVPEGYTAVRTIADLYAINNDLAGKYILMNDIDLSNDTKKGGDWDTGWGFTPIGYVDSSMEAFTGTFDGNGYQIKGMHIYGDIYEDEIYNCYAGLFGRLRDEAVVQNLALTDVSIEIEKKKISYYLYTGGVAGTCESTSVIQNCYTSGAMSLT